MIVGCPQCNRRYRLGEEYLGKYIRCICSAVLKVASSAADSFSKGENFNSNSTASSGPNQTTQEPLKYGVSIMDSIILPDFTKLIDLSQFSSDKEELPEIDHDLPSFDEDNFDEQDTHARQASLTSLDVSGPAKLDPRIPGALKALSKSQDPKFIVNMLYYLLEIKHFEIEETVKKFTNNANPLAAYFAQRILADFEQMRTDKRLQTQTVTAYDRTKLFSSLFQGSEQSKIHTIENAVNNIEEGSVPYLLCQLLVEKNINVIQVMLSRVSLLAGQLEIEFFAQFVRHKNQNVKYAAIEALGGIGGEKVIALLIPSLVDTDSNVVSAVKVALGTADQDEIARQIRIYLRKHAIDDLQGYMQIIQGCRSKEGFKGLVWMFDYQNIRQKAFEIAKEFDIPDEDKIQVIEEYLLVSFDDSPFTNEVIEYLELINTTYDRARLISVNIFDDSYIELVKLSPLFEKDFRKDEDGSSDWTVEETINIPIFNILEVLKAPVLRIKEELLYFKNFSQSKLGTPIVSLQILLYSSLGFMLFLTFLQGMGTNRRGLPTAIMPSKMKTTYGSMIFADPSFGPAFNTLLLAALLSILGAWFFGSFLAIAQLKKGSKYIRFLPMFPLLITPVIIGYTLGAIQNTLPGEILVQNLLAIGFLFPCISIFYLIYTRFFQLVPDSQLEIAKLLGAPDDIAHTTVYRPFYLIGTVFSTLLCILYIFSSHAMGFFIKSEEALGFIVMNKLEFPEGYLMLGAYAFPFLIATLVIVMIIEVFVPIACLFPMGIARPITHPEYRKMGEWLALIGSLFYSPSCYRRQKGSSKEQEVIEEEITEDESSKRAEIVEQTKQAEDSKPTVDSIEEDEDEMFDD